MQYDDFLWEWPQYNLIQCILQYLYFLKKWISFWKHMLAWTPMLHVKHISWKACCGKCCSSKPHVYLWNLFLVLTLYCRFYRKTQSRENTCTTVYSARFIHALFTTGIHEEMIILINCKNIKGKNFGNV